MDESGAPDLRALVRERGLLAQTEAVSWVAGTTIRGSWWSHPAGEAIFRALSALAEDPDVLPCKVLDGKQTYLHRSLWPALARARRERSLWPPCSEAARKLLAEVRRRGRLEASGRARLELERALEVVAFQEHTPSGKHVMVLTPFERWMPAEVLRAAEALSLEEALGALERAGLTLRQAPAGAPRERPASPRRRASPPRPSPRPPSRRPRRGRRP
jgi:hypothetical protein